VQATHIAGRFLSGGIILGSPLSYPYRFLYTITLPAVSCDALPTLSYTTLELASRVLLLSKKPAKLLRENFTCKRNHMGGFLDDQSTLDANSRVVSERVGGASQPKLGNKSDEAIKRCNEALNASSLQFLCQR
jgi:hypothetical protein